MASRTLAGPHLGQTMQDTAIVAVATLTTLTQHDELRFELLQFGDARINMSDVFLTSSPCFSKVRMSMIALPASIPPSW